jgi:hypothetical protein
MIRRTIIYIFAFIGILSIILHLSNCSKYNRAANKFYKKCAEVKEGMLLEKVKLIMGDSYEKEFNSEIFMHQGENAAPGFYLRYPTLIGNSIGIIIYFDPKTLIVTKIICGE